MAEDFIEEIYWRSTLLSDYRGCAEELYRGDVGGFGRIWKKRSSDLIRIIEEWRETDETSADSLERIAKGIQATLDDPAMTANLIEKGIIPLLYRYLELFGGIDVSENGWQLTSTASGFLTLVDETRKLHIHGMDNPHWEVRNLANKLYRPDATAFVILGGGLGYLPYQIWSRSFESLEIYILEKDSAVAEYARRYGVLDWIREGQLHVIVERDEQKLITLFNTIGSGSGRVIRYVSNWMIGSFSEEYRQAVADYATNFGARISFHDYYEVNFWQNSRRFTGEFTQLQEQMNCEEVIVVAAGPSLGAQYDYLRQNVGKKTIIAVSTVLRKLWSEGIRPDIVSVADPIEGVYEHLTDLTEEAFSPILVAESVANWHFLSVWKGPIYRVLGCGYEETVRECREKQIEGWDISGTVSSFAIEIGVRLGAKRVELIGLDLAYPGNQYYATGVGTSGNNEIIGLFEVPSVDGGMVPTVPAFDFFRRMIEKQISNYPLVQFINMSKHGALIKGTTSL